MNRVLAVLLLLLAAPLAHAQDASLRSVEITSDRDDVILESGGTTVQVYQDDKPLAQGVERRGDRLRVQVRDGGKLRVMVPVGLEVEVHGESADITARGSYARLALRSVSGALRGEVQAADLVLKSLSGDISLQLSAGRTDVETISGDVELKGQAADLRVRTTSGDVSVQGVLPRRLEVQTVSGDCAFRGTFPEDAWFTLRTVSGDVEVEAKEARGYRVLARSRTGSVTVRGGLSPVEDRHDADTAVGNGRGRIEVQTMSGEVRVDR